MKLLTPRDDPRIDRLLDKGPASTYFVPVPAGTVLLGSTLRTDEQPIVSVKVEAFECALTPVSNTEWAIFLADSNREPSAFWTDERFSHPAQPVVGVSWEDAAAYCDWLSELLGRHCRLPSEAEREHAAAGGATTLYPWGDEPWTEGPFARGSSGMDRPLPIGSTPPNGFGLYHMAENVHEWCADWYDPHAYKKFAEHAYGYWQSPVEVSDRRASRGGSWRHHLKVSRVSARSSLRPDASYNDYGLRVYV